MKLLNTLRWCLLIVLIAIIVIIAVRLKNAPEVSGIKFRDAMITELKPAIELCTVEIIEDVPVKGHIGTKHIFARATLCGYISFDLDSIKTDLHGDTLIVALPPEIVEIHESTLPGSYEVIDTWNEKLLGSSKFTAEEENAVKRKVADNFRKTIYAKGYVSQARADAVTTLNQMLSATTAIPVKVIDPSPEGYPSQLKPN